MIVNQIKHIWDQLNLNVIEFELEYKINSFIVVPNRITPDLTIGEIVQVRRLEYLCRCHILLAHLTRRNQPEYEVLLQKAYWFLMRLWQVEKREKYFLALYNLFCFCSVVYRTVLKFLKMLKLKQLLQKHQQLQVIQEKNNKKEQQNQLRKRKHHL